MEIFALEDGIDLPTVRRGREDRWGFVEAMRPGQSFFVASDKKNTAGYLLTRLRKRYNKNFTSRKETPEIDGKPTVGFRVFMLPGEPDTRPRPMPKSGPQESAPQEAAPMAATLSGGEASPPAVDASAPASVDMSKPSPAATVKGRKAA